MVIVGALVRTEASRTESVQQALAAMPGVTPFSLEQPMSVGLLIETATLDDAYRLLQQEVRNLEGVLGIWPVYSYFGMQESLAPHDRLA